MAFDITQYRQKYYIVRECPNGGGTLRLEIWEKTDTELSPQNIGELVALTLEIQGAQDKIDTAIVKTSLSWSIVDSYDIDDSNGTKHGNWDEFYTPDSTKYLVLLKHADNEGSSYVIRWSGYITPDSWQESLEYRGTVNVTARDNIGHLQDFEFDAPGDADGLISVEDIITQAMEKVAMPMKLVILDNHISGDDVAELASGDTSVRNMLIPVAFFEEKDWYESLEDVLDSLGWTLRYTDNNSIVVGPLRNLPLLGSRKYIDVQRQELTFVNGGTRTIDPAYKSIKESLRYECVSSLANAGNTGIEFDGTSTSYEFIYADLQIGSAPVHGTKANPGKGWSGDNAFLDVSKYAIASSTSLRLGASSDSCAFLAGMRANDAMQQTFSFGTVNLPVGRIALSLCPNACEVVSGNLRINDAFPLAGISYMITYTEPSGKAWVYDVNSWYVGISVASSLKVDEGSTTAQIDLSQAYNIGDLAPGGVLRLIIKQIAFTVEDLSKPGGLYLAISGVEFSLASDTLESLSSLTVTTVNDQSYNVEDKRDSAIGAAYSDVPWIGPDNYPNVLYSKTDGTLKMVDLAFHWMGEDGTLPLPVIIHLQQLCYHLTAFEILEGEAYAATLPRFDCLYTYKGNTLMVISATVDLIAGNFETAVFRQFLAYEDVWDSRLPEYDLSGGAESGSTGGSGSSSGGAGGGSLRTLIDNHINNDDIHISPEDRARWDLVAGLFYVDETGNVRVADKKGLSSDSFISAMGADAEAGGGSGLDITAMWAALAAGTSEQINESHIPDLSISKILGLQDALNNKIEGITKSMVEAVLTGNITSHTHDQYAIASNYYNKSEIDNKLASALTYKGSVQNYSDLPTTGNKKGDTWNVVEPYGDNYAWNGSSWDKLGGTYDFSVYALKADLNVASVGGNGKYIASISQTNGKISAVAKAIEFGEITGKPTTLSGYGITDGVNDVTANGNLTGSVSGHMLTIGVKSGYALPTSSQIALWDKICALFDVDSSGDVFVKGNRGLYSNSFISANGADAEAGGGSGGGINEDDLWTILRGNDSTEKISASHIPALSSLSGQLANAQLQNNSITIAGVGVALGGSLSTTQIASALSAAGYKLTDTIYTLPKATASALGGVKVAAVRSTAITTTQGGTTSGRYYGIELDSNGKAFVNVPWVNTTYSLSSFGITATAAELNKLDGLATTAKELSYVHGVTSSIQDQLDAKANALDIISRKTHSSLQNLDLDYAINNFGSSSSGDNSSQINAPTRYGMYLSLALGSTNMGGQLFFGAAGNYTGTDYLYVRTRGAGPSETKDWGDWRTVLDSVNYTNYTVTKTGAGASGTWGINITGSARYLSPTYIPENADLNDYTTSGMYYCGSNAVVQTMSNCPTTNAFSLLVEHHAGAKQTLTEYYITNPRTWFRNYYNGNWGSWYSIPFAGAVNVGSSANPVYVSNDKILACGYSFGNASGNAAINNRTLNTDLNADLLDGHEYQNILERRFSGYTAMSSAGWYRIAATQSSNAQGSSFRLFIQRMYNTQNNEAYSFDISIGYNNAVSITQTSGIASVRLISKIRVTGPANGVQYIDIYYSRSTNNDVFWTTIGDAVAYKSATFSPEAGDITTEFETTNGCKTNGESTVESSLIAGKNIQANGNLVCGTTITVDPRNSFRSSIFGNSTNGYRIKEVRTDLYINKFCEKYGAALAWAGQDTHAWLAVGYSSDTKSAYIGGGSSDIIHWSEQLWHSGNSNLTTVDWAAKNLTLAGNIGGVTSITMSNNLYMTNPDLRIFLGTASGAFITGNASSFRICSHNNQSFVANLLSLDMAGNATIAGSINVAGKANITGSLVLPYFGGMWKQMVTQTGVIEGKQANGSNSAHTLFRLKNNGGDMLAFGGYNEQIGFYGFTAETIAAETNAADFRTYWNVATGSLVHNKAMSIGNTLWVGSSFTAAGKAYLNNGVETTSIVLKNGSKTATISLDDNGNIHITSGIYSDSFISARGVDTQAAAQLSS